MASKSLHSTSVFSSHWKTPNQEKIARRYRRFDALLSSGSTWMMTIAVLYFGGHLLHAVATHADAILGHMGGIR